MQEQLRELFADLDRQYFDGRLSAANITIGAVNLDKPGELEFYTMPDGSLRAFKIDDDGILGIYIHEIRRMFFDHHDDGREQEFRPTLLHEMAHAAVELNRPLRKGEDDHGRRFCASCAAWSTPARSAFGRKCASTP